MMFSTPHRRRIAAALTAAGSLVVTGLTGGCRLNSCTYEAIPASRLDPVLRGCSRESLAPLPLSELGQPKPEQHSIGPGDTLAVYIFGILPAEEEITPVTSRSQTINQQYYPPYGSEVGSRTGVPVPVAEDGTIELPLVGRVNVAGLSLPQATDRVVQVYREEEVLQEGRERVHLQLITPRTKRIVVMRQDSPAKPASLVTPDAIDQIHRGSGTVIDLPIYQNDVLHALAASGGLPGTDAARELWIVRGGADQVARTYLDVSTLRQWNRLGALPSPVDQGYVDDVGGVMIDTDMAAAAVPAVTRIPLVGCPGAALPFDPAEVILHEGDVLFVPRRHEHFVTGGMLPGARIPLPRDEDIDVLEAIAMSTGSVGGPLGLSGEMLSGGAPGHMREPTRVLVLRKLPDGRQLPIRVDLDRAMRDHKERILIRDEDVVMLYFKPSAAALNGSLNFTRFSIIPRIGGDN